MPDPLTWGLVMAKRHPLDAKIAVADLFITGRLSGPTPIDTIAELAEVKPASAVRIIRLHNFATVKKRNRVVRTNPRVWQPPRRVTVPPRSRTITRTIADLYASGDVRGRTTADALAERLGTSPKSVGASLKKLGFTVAVEKQHKHVGWECEVVRPPLRWNDLFMRQRELRRDGLSASAVMRVTDAGAKIDGLIREAVRQLDLEAVPRYIRGALKKQVQKTIQEIYYAYRESTSVLGQPKAPPPVDWAAIAELEDWRIGRVARIAARVGKTEEDPAGYALRWVRENLPAGDNNGHRGSYPHSEVEEVRP